MKKGDLIVNPYEKIQISKNAQFSRKTLKHFVEQRLKDGNTAEEINYLVEKAQEVVNDPELMITNPNQKYKGSLLLTRFYIDVHKAVIVILDDGNEIRDIITIYFKNKKDFDTLLQTYRK